jgi:hypothetical protein
MSTQARRVAAWLLATGTAVAAITAQSLSVSLAPQAHADRVVSVNDLCNGYKPGHVPMIAGFTLGAVYCTAPGTLPLQGLSDGNAGRVMAGNLPGLPPGSYQVNPFDPFSAWVIPG